jgi:Rab-like protein 2
MLIWDLLGEVRFQELHKTYFQGTEGALLVCDISRSDTVRSLRDWDTKLSEVVGKIPIIIMCNKIDLKKMSNEEKGLVASEAHAMGDVPYMFSSAKTGQNVEKAFFTLAQSMLQGLPY